MSWREAWSRDDTPWDAGESAPELQRLLSAGELPEGRVLVPGCGSGYDVLELARHGREAVGLDVAPGAERRFRALRRRTETSSQLARFVVDDFFDYSPEQPFDALWDYTFLCAIEPDRREEWVDRVAELLRPGGMLAILLFPVVPPGIAPVSEEVDGPPYPLEPDRVWSRLESDFHLLELRPTRRSHEPRAGKEWIGRWRRRPPGES